MKRVEVGVRKVEMWEEANWSMRLRYLPKEKHRYQINSFGEAGRGWGYVHLVVCPHQFIHEIQATMYDERVHMASFLAEAWHTIAALFRSTELELEEGRVVGIDNREVIGHCGSPGLACGYIETMLCREDA